MKLFLMMGALLASVQPAPKTFVEHRSYHHHHFISSEACEEAQRGHMRFNCRMTLNLRPDGTATVMVTDIMNAAKYSIVGNKLVVTANGPGDIPEEITFSVDNSQRNLIREGTTEVWELETTQFPVPGSLSSDTVRSAKLVTESANREL